MKISIAWVFDHIDADWKKLDMARLTELFIQTTAEIDRVYKIEVDTQNMMCLEVSGISDQVTLHSSELNKDFVLPKRTDARVGGWYLFVNDKGTVRWATLVDLGSGKDGLVPPLIFGENDGPTGNWKKNFESVDYIFELDNKSINHRPDMWGHRGVAREMAAMLGLKLKPLDPFLAKLEIIQYGDSAPATADQPFALSIQNPVKCSRFGALYMHNVEHRPSDLFMAARLARVDGKPINAIVDATNYTMFDLGHPMHAFDAGAIPNKSIEARDAKNGDKLQLLDGEEVTLTQDDLVFASGNTSLDIAGIMGGASSAVSPKTTELLLEAGCFDAAMIRKTAERVKKRTEASTRFEKSMDPNNNVNALRRFAQLLNDLKVPNTSGKTISSLGKPAVSPVITVEHAYIESRLGTKLEPAQVIAQLQKVGFEVAEKGASYEAIVPTFRATKDIQGKQDIVEEVGRMFGYNNITPELPQLPLKPADLHVHNQIKIIKDTCAFVGNMREVASYNFFDEAFIQSLGWEPGETLAVRSPVSQNWQRLVTTLVPNLLKGIHENCADYDQLRFFEMAAVYLPGTEVKESPYYAKAWKDNIDFIELKSLTGLIFEKKKALSFYDGKAILHELFERLALQVTWVKLDAPNQPYFTPFQTAQIKHNEIVIGIAAMMPQAFLSKMSEGHAFVFELDADFLINYRAPIKPFTALPKFQPNVRDISLLLPASDTVEEMSRAIVKVDPRIKDVILIDYLESLGKKDRRPEEAVGEDRCATFRFAIYEETKTLTKPEIDAIVQSVSDVVVARGATIR